jgi:hypothetical protein
MAKKFVGRLSAVEDAAPGQPPPQKYQFTPGKLSTNLRQALDILSLLLEETLFVF